MKNRVENHLLLHSFGAQEKEKSTAEIFASTTWLVKSHGALSETAFSGSEHSNFPLFFQSSFVHVLQTSFGTSMSSVDVLYIELD